MKQKGKKKKKWFLEKLRRYWPKRQGFIWSSPSLLFILFFSIFLNAGLLLSNHLYQQELEESLRRSLFEERLPREHLKILAEEKKLDLTLLNTIVFCESRWRMVDNATSSAYGYFQIIDGTERLTPQYKEGKRKFDSYTNIEMGVYLFEKYGAFPWYESKPCWSSLASTV